MESKFKVESKTIKLIVVESKMGVPDTGREEDMGTSRSEGTKSQLTRKNVFCSLISIEQCFNHGRNNVLYFKTAQKKISNISNDKYLR